MSNLKLEWAWVASRPHQSFFGSSFTFDYHKESGTVFNGHYRNRHFRHWGQADSWRNDGSGSSRLFTDTDQIPIPTGDNEAFALIAVLKTIGAGNQLASQCRIAAKGSETSSATSDYDWMLGMETTGVLRTRFNIITPTTVLGTLAMQADALNVCGIVRHEGVIGWRNVLVREDGQGELTASLGSRDGAYTPRSVSDYPTALGGNSQGVRGIGTSSSQSFQGDLLALYLFTGADFVLEDARRIMADPWQFFPTSPIIGAHQLPEHVNWGAIEVESQGPNGYTIDFSRDKLSPSPDGTFGTVNTVEEYGIWATSDVHTWIRGANYLRTSDTNNIPLWGLAPSKFKFGPWQFSEVDVFITVPSLRISSWVGPAVFIGGMRADTGWSDNNCYAVLCERAGAGTSIYRLYKRRSEAWYQFGSDQTGPDASIRPVRLRIEAMDNGSATSLRWWVDGVEMPSYVDTEDNYRVRYFPGPNGQAGLVSSYVGASWGSGSAGDSVDRKITRLRAGNMPEIKIKKQVVPINEDLPELYTFEEPWDDMPL